MGRSLSGPAMLWSGSGTSSTCHKLCPCLAAALRLNRGDGLRPARANFRAVHRHGLRRAFSARIQGLADHGSRSRPAPRKAGVRAAAKLCNVSSLPTCRATTSNSRGRAASSQEQQQPQTYTQTNPSLCRDSGVTAGCQYRAKSYLAASIVSNT